MNFLTERSSFTFLLFDVFGLIGKYSPVLVGSLTRENELTLSGSSCLFIDVSQIFLHVQDLHGVGGS